jgi:uncharacterized membrane protein
MVTRIRILTAFILTFLVLPQTHYAQGHGAHGQPGGGPAGIGTISALPALGSNSEALAVNTQGTAIVGQAFDRQGILHAIRWTSQNGAWVLGELLRPSDAVSATARGVNTFGAAAGNDSHASPAPPAPAPPPDPVFWPPASNSPTYLGCGEAGMANVYAMSANAQVAVGGFVDGQTHLGAAAVWQPGSCLVTLPSLDPRYGSSAHAVNGDGTIVGGTASLSLDSGVPVRWHNVAGVWEIEQLDTRDGLVWGGNAAGDLVGYVYDLPCATTNGCSHAVIWEATGVFASSAPSAGRRAPVSRSIRPAR